MKVQVIGLPGSGKSYLLKKYLKERDLKSILYIDMASEEFNTKETCYVKDIKLFKKKIQNTSRNVLAESACGVSLGETKVIKLIIDNVKRRKQFKKRENKDADIQYESLLETKMVPAAYTVKNEETLFNVLDALFKR